MTISSAKALKLPAESEAVPRRCGENKTMSATLGMYNRQGKKAYMMNFNFVCQPDKVYNYRLYTEPGGGRGRDTHDPHYGASIIH